MQKDATKWISCPEPDKKRDSQKQNCYHCHPTLNSKDFYFTARLLVEGKTSNLAISLISRQTKEHDKAQTTRL